MTATIRAIGFVFPHSRPALSDPEEYNDFAGAEFDLGAARPMLDTGAFPLGLLLQVEQDGKTGPLGVVVDDGNGGQTVEMLKGEKWK